MGSCSAIAPQRKQKGGAKVPDIVGFSVWRAWLCLSGATDQPPGHQGVGWSSPLCSASPDQDNRQSDQKAEQPRFLRGPAQAPESYSGLCCSLSPCAGLLTEQTPAVDTQGFHTSHWILGPQEVDLNDA